MTAGLAALAAWSGLFALAAVTGLGGRHSVLGDDPSLVPELPQINLEQAVSRLEGQGSYAGIGDRPLFNHDRRPLPPVQSADSSGVVPPPAPTAMDAVLTSVILGGERKIAIVFHAASNTSQSVAVGAELKAELAGWRLTDLQPRMAVFEGPGGSKSLELRVFDGAGGQPPTAIAEPMPAPDAAPAVGADGQPVAVDSPEARAELIRRRIEERRRQMREESERARQ
jgi:general secretion pathway protein N